MNNSKMKTIVLHSKTSNPWFNLATEDWIFREMNPEGHTLFLWRNSETVVIGRYQNPWLECRLDKMKQDDVKLARRQSGGGAVYQDHQNLNFTFMSGADVYDKDRNFEIIIDAISKFGIKAETSGRNDMLVDGKKISGSAFKLTKDRAFHHGTLLVDVNLGKLVDYLNPDQLKLKSKGIKSVKSRVANLKEFNNKITVEDLSAAITESFFTRLGAGTEDDMDLDSLEKTPGLVKYYDVLKSDNWLYRKSPDFTHRLTDRFEWGGIEINLNIKQGKVTGIEIFTDSLYPEMIEKLEQGLKNLEYSRTAVDSVVTELAKQNADWSRSLDDIARMLSAEIRA